MTNAIMIMASTSLPPSISDRGRLQLMWRKWLQLCGCSCWGLIIVMASNSRTLATFAPSDSLSLITVPLIPHHELVRRRLRRGLAEPDEAALYQGYGTHYIDLYCGTSTPQHQTVSVDTGSGYSAFPCSGCNGCGSHLDPYYQPGASNSFRKSGCNQCQAGTCSAGNSQCQFGASYQEGSSWSAYEATDQCFVGDSSTSSSVAFNLFFGCQTKVTSFFVTQKEDGIMGMSNSKASFWYQMYNAGKLQQQMFSICYSPSPNLSRDSNGADSGILTLGGSDSNWHTTPMVYTVNTTSANDSFFRVSIRNVYLREGDNGTFSSSTKSLVTVQSDVGRTVLALNVFPLNPSGGTIVDSGSTLTAFPTFWSAAFRQAWFELVGTAYNTNILVPPEELNSLPTILLQFEGDNVGNVAASQQTLDNSSDVSTGLAAVLDPDHPYDVIVSFPPSHYMVYNNTVGKYQPILAFRGFYTGTTVLGANFIMGHDVLFDVENNRLGWAESSCNYSQAAGNDGHALRTSSSSGIQSLPPTMNFMLNHIVLVGVGVMLFRLLL